MHVRGQVQIFSGVSKEQFSIIKLQPTHLLHSPWWCTNLQTILINFWRIYVENVDENLCNLRKFSKQLSKKKNKDNQIYCIKNGRQDDVDSRKLFTWRKFLISSQRPESSAASEKLLSANFQLYRLSDLTLHIIITTYCKLNGN